MRSIPCDQILNNWRQGWETETDGDGESQREEGEGTEPPGRDAVINGRKVTNAISAISELLTCIHHHVQDR